MKLIGESRPQDPQNAIQDSASILPWSAAPILVGRRFRNMLGQDLPLCVNEVSVFVTGIESTPVRAQSIFLLLQQATQSNRKGLRLGSMVEVSLNDHTAEQKLRPSQPPLDVMPWLAALPCNVNWVASEN